MTDNISPEEKLLKHIRRKPLNDLPAPLTKNTQISELKVLPKESNYVLAKKIIPIINVYKSLFILLAVGSVYLIVSFLYPIFAFKKIKLPEINKAQNISLRNSSKQERKSLDFYTKNIMSNRIFNTGFSQEIKKTAMKAKIDLFKDLALIGIISGNNPQAIIEDKKNQKCYYLSKGQLLGELQIEAVLEEKVIINYDGRNYELYL